jgi:hypothetical protein
MHKEPLVPKAVEGQLVTEFELDARKRLELLAWLLDDSIQLPGLNMRIGIDGLLGLIPGLGDVLSALISSYIVAEASRLGASRAILLRMSGNVLVDTVIGSVPFIGDLFDLGFKANRRNVQLLTEFLDDPQKTTRSTWFFCVLLVLVFLLSCVVVFYLLRAASRLFWAGGL